MQSHLQAAQQQVSDPFAAMAAAKSVGASKSPAKAAPAKSKGPQRGAGSRASARANPGDPFANMVCMLDDGVGGMICMLESRRVQLVKVLASNMWWDLSCC
jgi:hypothetical protein